MRVGILILLSLCTSLVIAQNSIKPKKPIVCYGSGVDENTILKPPASYRELLNNPGARVQTATFDVTYIGFTDQAKAAFQKAVDIWATLITSSQPIKVIAEWKPLGSGVLGSAIWGSAHRNFPSAPQVDTYYPVALAEKIAGRPLNNPDSSDIFANFSSTMTWSYKLDGTTVSGKYDLVSVVLHELGHGLGFVDSYSVSGSEAVVGVDNGLPIIYDLYLENSTNQNIFDAFVSPSTTLKTQLTSSKVYYNSPLVLSGNNNTHAKIYAPSTYSAGSSISHLDEATYPAGNQNSLMTPNIGAAEIMHDPGPIVKSAFSDMGWVFTRIDHTPLPNTESVSGPFTVTATVTSDVGSVNNLTLHYNTGGSDVNVPMAATGNANEYAADIPSTNAITTYSYYISADDAIRTYTNPGKKSLQGNGVKQTYFSFTASPDTEPPVIDHQPITSILNTSDSLEIDATVTDNLGVKFVLLDYYINDVPMSAKWLPYNSTNQYSFTIKFNNLNIGDNIKYRITARDTAVIGNAQGNVAYSPSSSEFDVVKVIGLQPAQDSYANDFNTPSLDFYGNGFSITTPDGFTSPAINSDHPYKEGHGYPNDQINLIYELLTPIRVKSSDATIKFDEIVLVEPGVIGAAFGTDNFFDYVVVEGSTDAGKTWTAVANGYDSNDKSDWLTRYNSATNAAGDPSLYHTRILNLLTKFSAGQEVVLRFRLYSDPYSAGWGWAIDNLKIQIDETPPVILHTYADYILPGSTSLPIALHAADVSGIKDVSIEYTINQGQVQTQTLTVGQQQTDFSTEISMDGLSAGDTIAYHILTTDNVNNTGMVPSSGYIKTVVFEPGTAVAQYENDFNTSSIDFIGNFYNVSKPSGFTNAMINSTHFYPTGFGLDQTSNFSYMLNKPIIINPTNPYIHFDEIVLVEGHAAIVSFGNPSFNDYVIVEGSADGGATWKNFSDGYDAADQSVWTTAFNGSKSGLQSMYKPRTINMMTNTGFSANDNVLIRFRLFSNAITNGWGWAIDNLSVQGTITAIEETHIAESLKVYPNPTLGTLTVEVENPNASAVAVSMINTQGETIMVKDYTAQGISFQQALDVHELPAGLYLISVHLDGKTINRKFIKRNN